MTDDRNDLGRESSRLRRRGMLSTLLLFLVCALIIWWFLSRAFAGLEALQAQAESAGGHGTDAGQALGDLLSRLESAADGAGASGENLVGKIESLAAQCPPQDGGGASDPAPCREVMRPCPSASEPRQSFLIYFVFNSSDLDPTKRETIQEAADLARRCKGSKVTVYGHTDRFGAAADNMTLSAARAAVVADQLAEQLQRQVEAVPLGETRPAVPSDDRNELNRRAEIVIE